VKADVRVAIVGVSGFTGGELVELLGRDRRFRLTGAMADRWQGEALGARLPVRGRDAALVVRPMADAASVCAEADVALLATPAEVSVRLVPELLSRNVRVLDLSGAFRLVDDAQYPLFYGFDHPAKELLAEAHYGLPDLPRVAGSGPEARASRLVANPGCYATAAILALAPLVAEGLIEGPLFVDGKSGVSGAGRKLAEHLLFTEVNENVSPYRVGRHQHTPEIEQALARAAGGREVAVTFTPHLMPITRGLSVAAYGKLAEHARDVSIREVYARCYASSDVVKVVAPEEVTIARAARTPLAIVGGHADPSRRSIVALAAIDNLLKGAASQAMENLCRMVGLPFHDDGDAS
jgi:N-acetyl-gamma-glutamyl-phosphate reductase